MIPPNRPLRVVGDVHGDLRGLTAALATDRFVIQLGDLVDNGPDSAGTLRAMLARQRAGDGLFLLGNHDHKLARALMGRDIAITPELAETLAQLDEPLRAEALDAFSRAPAWLRLGDAFFVHGGFHSAMLTMPSPRGITRVHGVLARALYGEPTGRTQPDGYPERSLAWVQRIPPGLTIYCGHDNRSPDGRPATHRNPSGGTAIFMDTGAGKGGHLSWLDLPAGAATRAAMRERGLAPDLILVSPARRTQETLALLEPWDDTPLVEILESLYLAPAERLLEELRLVAETVRSVLLIGHNPGLHDLAAVLLGPKGLDSDSPAVNHLIEGYPTGALAEFSVAGTWRDLDTGGGRLLHFIRPRDLAGDLTGADA